MSKGSKRGRVSLSAVRLLHAVLKSGMLVFWPVLGATGVSFCVTLLAAGVLFLSGAFDPSVLGLPMEWVWGTLGVVACVGVIFGIRIGCEQNRTQPVQQAVHEMSDFFKQGKSAL